MSVAAPLHGEHRGQRHAIPDGNVHKNKHPAVKKFAARFIAPWEGFLPQATLDTIADPPVETIGFGHTGNVHPGERWSRERAERVLAHDIGWASAAVVDKVKHRLSVRQRIALISFVFNLGPGVLEGELLATLNRGEFKRAASMMEGYDHAGGVVVQGLLNRRKAEAWMMRHPHRPTRNPHKPQPPKHKKGGKR